MSEEDENSIHLALAVLDERSKRSSISMPDYEHLYLFAAGRLNEVPVEKRPELLRALALHPEALSVVAELRRSGMIEERIAESVEDIQLTAEVPRPAEAGGSRHLSDAKLFIRAVSGEPNALDSFRRTSPPAKLLRIAEYLPHHYLAAAGGAVTFSPPPLPVSRLRGAGPHEFSLLPPNDSREQEGNPIIAIRGLTRRSQELIDAGAVRLTGSHRVEVKVEEKGWLRFLATYSTEKWNNSSYTIPLAIGPAVMAAVEGEDTIERVLCLADQLAGHAAWSMVLNELAESDEPVRSALLCKIAVGCKEGLQSSGMPLSPSDEALTSIGSDFKGRIIKSLERLMMGILSELDKRFKVEGA